ncbi:MAG: calcium-binding protein [Desulfurivibrionaceae bacterium]|jgi:hypothetical protein
MFGQAITLADLHDLTKGSNNLVLKVGITGDQITTINSWFSGATYQMDRFTFVVGAELLANNPVYSNGITSLATRIGLSCLPCYR